MNNIVQFILNGSTEFTPEVFIRIIIFVLMLDMISDIISVLFKGVR